MANDAVKKRDRKLTQTSALYFKIFAGVQAAYITFRIMLFWKTYSSWWGWATLVTVQIVCSKLILSAIGSGRPYSYYQDILYIAWFIQATLIITDYAWITALLIPGYAVFKIGGYVFGSLKASEAAQVPEMQMSEKERKKQAKVERQAKQQEARFGKRG